MYLKEKNYKYGYSEYWVDERNKKKDVVLLMEKNYFQQPKNEPNCVQNTKGNGHQWFSAELGKQTHWSKDNHDKGSNGNEKTIIQFIVNGFLQLCLFFLIQIMVERLQLRDVNADLLASYEKNCCPGYGAHDDAQSEDPLAKGGEPAKVHHYDEQTDAQWKQPDDWVWLFQLTVRPYAYAKELRH